MVCFSETKPKPEFYKEKKNLKYECQFPNSLLIFSPCSTGVLRKAFCNMPGGSAGETWVE